MKKSILLFISIIQILQFKNNKFNLKGVCIPVYKEIYEPILKELNQLGIIFTENHY